MLGVRGLFHAVAPFTGHATDITEHRWSMHRPYRRVFLCSEMTPTTTEEAGKKRWKGVKKKDHLAISAKGGQTAWKEMSSEQRSAEMKRRAVVRAENAKKKAHAEARAKKKTKK
jgi:hypothetical protein